MTSPARLLLLLCIMTALALVPGRAQSPQIIVQAASAAPAPSTTVTTAATVTQDISSVPAAIKLLEQIKAANDETLKKQEAALQQLDEIAKTAEQIKVFSHRD
jgi:hypothetical protein